MTSPAPPTAAATTPHRRSPTLRSTTPWSRSGYPSDRPDPSACRVRQRQQLPAGAPVGAPGSSRGAVPAQPVVRLPAADGRAAAGLRADAAGPSAARPGAVHPAAADRDAWRLSGAPAAAPRAGYRVRVDASRVAAARAHAFSVRGPVQPPVPGPGVLSRRDGTRRTEPERPAAHGPVRGRAGCSRTPFRTECCAHASSERAVEPWGLDGDRHRMPSDATDRAVTPRHQPRTSPARPSRHHLITTARSRGNSPGSPVRWTG